MTRRVGAPPVGGASRAARWEWSLRLLTIGCCLVAQPAQAQFAVDRTELELRTDVPTERVGVLLVRNEGAQRAQARLLVEDWDRDALGGNRFHPAGTVAGSCHPQLTVEPRTLVLDPGESQPVQVRVNSGAAGVRQECWSVVLVESVQPRPSATGRMLLYTIRTGVKVYAAAAALPREVAIAAMTMQWPSVATTTGGVSTRVASGPSPAPGPLAPTGPQGSMTALGDSLPMVQLSVTNLGARHVTAHGRLELRREDNRVAASIPLPVVYALPGATRQLSVALPTLARGRYLLLAVFDYGGDELTAAQLEIEVP